MATKKVGSYINMELEWLERKFQEAQMAIDNYDLKNLQDRYGPRMMPNGKIVDALIESRSDQLKTIMYIMEKLPKMVSSLDELREKEAKKKLLTKGDVELSGIMEDNG